MNHGLPCVVIGLELLHYFGLVIVTYLVGCSTLILNLQFLCILRIKGEKKNSLCKINPNKLEISISVMKNYAL